MADYYAKVSWTRKAGETFVDNQYSRGHRWAFDGGALVPASSSPHIVPLPFSVEENVDPEEAFVASLSSCHMLFFLSLAAKRRFCIDSYVDDAVGTMAKDEQGRDWVSEVVLRPRVCFSGDRQPDAVAVVKLHHWAHEACFIANSVKTRVSIEPVG